MVIEASVTPAPLHSNDVYENSIADSVSYARLYKGYIGGFAESALRLHLFGVSAKNATEIGMLSVEFFTRLNRYYQVEPGRCPWVYAATLF